MIETERLCFFLFLYRRHLSVAILNYFLVFVMQFRTSTLYAVVEFMSYVDQHHQGATSEHVTEELPEISDQGGAVGGATHTPDVPESSHMQANVHVGADAGSQSPPHASTGGTNGSAEHVHEQHPSNMESGDDVCGSLEEWLHALPTIEELEVGFFLATHFFLFHIFCIFISLACYKLLSLPI